MKNDIQKTVRMFGIKFKLNGAPIQVGEKLEFKAKDRNNEIWDITKIKGKKIISLFPAIRTYACNKQTMLIAQIAQKNPKVNIISISTDKVEVINKWCLDRSFPNAIILSDSELHEFSDKSGLLVLKTKRLARGFILLDENNNVVDINICKDIVRLPDFVLLQSWINNW